MKYIINIHSVVNVITNSSSIIYVVDDNKTEEDILNLLQSFIDIDEHEGNYSGQGGSVYVFHEKNEDYITLNVDWSMKHTINAIKTLLKYTLDD